MKLRNSSNNRKCEFKSKLTFNFTVHARPKTKKCFYVDEIPERYRPGFSCAGKKVEAERKRCEGTDGFWFDIKKCKCRPKVSKTTTKGKIK